MVGTLNHSIGRGAAGLLASLLILSACAGPQASSSSASPTVSEAASTEASLSAPPSASASAAAVDRSEILPVRFAYCPNCTSQGVEGIILEDTNIAEIVGLDMEILALAPPAMGEGIASESLDVEWVGSQPTLAQLANDIPIYITAFQYDFELRMVATDAVESTADLAGKKIGVPFGTTAFQMTNNVLLKEGLEPGVDVELINVQANNLSPAVSEGAIDVATIWDPVWGVLMTDLDMHSIASERHTGFTNMRGGFVEENREAAIRFLEAQIIAVAFRANNAEEANQRYEERYGIPVAIAEEAQTIDRSIDWQDLEDVDLSLQDQDTADLENTLEFVLEANLIPREIDVLDAIDESMVEEAMARVRSGEYDLADVTWN